MQYIKPDKLNYLTSSVEECVTWLFFPRVSLIIFHSLVSSMYSLVTGVSSLYLPLLFSFCGWLRWQNGL